MKNPSVYYERFLFTEGSLDYFLDSGFGPARTFFANAGKGLRKKRKRKITLFCRD